MLHNQVIDTLLNRKSIRKYTDQMPTDEEIETLVRAAQQAPFAGQMCSLLLKRKAPKAPFKAPLLFTVCIDIHKLEMIMRKRGWETGSCDLALFQFGVQDAVLMAENLVIAAESLGMGSCFIGDPPYRAGKIRDEYRLPERVFPIVQLVVGFPDENPPTRPRYPMEYFLFEDQYPELTEAMIDRAIEVMDRGYLAQDYYRKADYMVPLEQGKKETFTFERYSWTEHMSRKWGQWTRNPDRLIEGLKECGFDLTSGTDDD